MAKLAGALVLIIGGIQGALAAQGTEVNLWLALALWFVVWVAICELITEFFSSVGARFALSAVAALGVIACFVFVRPQPQQPSPQPSTRVETPVEAKPVTEPTTQSESKPTPGLSAAELVAEFKKLATPTMERPVLVVNPYVRQGENQAALFTLEVTNNGPGAEVRATFDIEEPIRLRAFGLAPSGPFVAKWTDIKTEWQRIATGHSKYIEIGPPPMNLERQPFERMYDPFKIVHLNGGFEIGEPFVPIVMTFEAKPDLEKLFKIQFTVPHTYISERPEPVIWRSDDPTPSASDKASPRPSRGGK